MKDESSILFLNHFEHSDAPAAASEKTITRLVFDAVSENKPTLAAHSASDEVPPEVMLRLVTYCYAKGLYGSREIERKLRKNPVRQDSPDAQAIRRFRRLNHAALQNTLEKTLQSMQPAATDKQTIVITRQKAAEKLETAAIFDMTLEE